MVKLVLLKKRKDGVSREEYVEFLKEVHAPESIAELPKIRSYTAAVPVDPDETEWDSVEVHTYDSPEDLDEALSTEVAERGHAKLEEVVDLDSEIAVLVEGIVDLEDIN